MFDKDFFDWIETHKSEDSTKLRFQYHGKDNPWWIDIAITNIELMAKASKKLTDRKGSVELVPDILPSKLSLEQTTSYEIAKLHSLIFSENVPEGSMVFDMTCGLGTDARALALRGYKVIACDVNHINVEIARFNFRNFANVEVIEGNSVDILENLRHIDSIMIDPARRSEKGERLYNIGQCSPDMNSVVSIAKTKSNFLLAKLSPMLDIKQTLIDLKHVSKLHIVGENNECKELLTEFDFKTEISIPLLKIPIAVHTQPWLTNFEYTLDDENKSEPLKYGTPQKGDYLYFPDNALLKAGCYKLISKIYAVHEIAPNTHLFLSKEKIKRWPGRIHKIIDIVSWKSSSLKNFRKIYPVAEISVKNFGMSADELAKKLKSKNGSGAVHVTGITDIADMRLLVVSESC